MKALCLVSACSLLLVGCNDSAKLPDGSSNNPATAPVDYLNNAAKAEKHATKTIDLTAVNKAIEQFYVQEGRFPKDLLELVEMKYLPLLPKLPDGANWDYDTNSGVATIQKRGQ